MSDWRVAEWSHPPTGMSIGDKSLYDKCPICGAGISGRVETLISNVTVDGEAGGCRPYDDCWSEDETSAEFVLHCEGDPDDEDAIQHSGDEMQERYISDSWKKENS